MHNFFRRRRYAEELCPDFQNARPTVFQKICTIANHYYYYKIITKLT